MDAGYEQLTGIKPTIEASLDPNTEREIHVMQRKSDSAKTIYRAWKSYIDRRTFKWLRENLYRAERSMTFDILKRLAPQEANLLQDKVIQAKVRFRFGGSAFPPKIYYKVYTKGGVVHYFSGSRMIAPGTRAAKDSHSLMGSRVFQQNMLLDQYQRHIFKTTQPYEVTDKLECIQYLNSLDYRPSHLGGRSNTWREMTIFQLHNQALHLDFDSNKKKTAYYWNSSSRSNSKTPDSVSQFTKRMFEKMATTAEPNEWNQRPLLQSREPEQMHDDFGLLFEWTHLLNPDHLHDYTIVD